MLQSENLNELFTALSKAQGQFSAAVKDAKNPFFKSNYADLNSVFDAFRVPLAANGLCVSQLVSIIDGNNVLVTMLGHSSGQWIKSHSPIITTKNDAQGFGAGVTYMRRYALVSMLGISQEDDDGESTLTEQQKEERRRDKAGLRPQAANSPQKPSAQQVENLQKVLEDCPRDFVDKINGIMDSDGIKEFRDLPLPSFEKIYVSALKVQKKKVVE